MLILDEKAILEKSLNSGITMTFAEFVSFNDIDLDSIKVDKFFHGINNDIPILMDAAMIKYFGYSDDMPEETPKQIRDKNKKQKEGVRVLLDTNFLEYKNQLWWSYSTEEYEKFLKSDHSGNKNLKDLSPEMIQKLYPIHKKKGRQPTYILVMPKLIKEGLILCQTEKGKQVRRFYIDMMDTMEVYIQYQNKLTISTLEQKLDKMLIKLDTTEKKADEERKKADEERKKADERFQKLLGVAEDTNDTLSTVAKQHVEINKLDYLKHPHFIIMKDPNDDKMPYYAIRRQKESLQEAIDEITADFPDLTIWLKIPQPNAVAFFNLIKKELNQYMNRCKNWFGITGITPLEFKEKVKKLNQLRLNPPKKTRPRTAR